MADDDLHAQEELIAEKLGLNKPRLYTREEFLIIRMLEMGADLPTAREGVATTAIANDWDLTEKRTFLEWLDGKKGEIDG